MSKKKIILIIGVTLAITALIFALYSSKKESTQKPKNEVSQANGINFEPPTDEDKQRAADNKNNIEQRERAIEEAQKNNDGSRKTVVPTITYADKYGTQVEVGAYVSGIYEDGGICTAKFSKDGKDFTKSVSAVKNVNSVDCPVIEVPLSEFPSQGTWSVRISYDSSTASGTSETKTVEVK